MEQILSFEKEFKDILKRRLEGEPLQYILGSVEFFGLEFRIDRRVFIPRPETELLVEEVLSWHASRSWKLACPGVCSRQAREAGSWKFETMKVLDIGTGSGNIAISIAKMMQGVEIVAVDISQEAIEVAKENAKLNRVSDKLEFLTGDLYKSLIKKNIKFDCIVSNPPYIASNEFGGLQKEVLWEPRVALDGGLEGLLFIGQIICGARSLLKDGGCLFLEIGYNQAIRVEQILRENNFEDIYFVKDYNGIERIVVAGWIDL